MSWNVSFTCDICGKQKGEDSHWWMAMLGDVPCWDEGQPRQRFTLLPWNEGESHEEGMLHLCGQSCAMQALERFMTTGRVGTIEDESEEVAGGDEIPRPRIVRG